ncbi:helix-turn-helix domain-containing protein [Mucilaginibacter aquatilis]|uniref:Helix-turn-helix domain-containing protein n=1 Tax=Mucilaginibacter aquatilis TaxID=1517760 RepID=A0A6I4I6J4_9SPHI|nr:helix-turn-helix domain-containing protein [Mucilaginibacter aquatilis]MVN90497.1 helix-turn-helix domain-containing protein [Mucilaginibacter aquatilis]
MQLDELLTKKDLQDFKAELFELLKPILENKNLYQKKWLKTKDVREILNISNNTLQNLRVEGKLGYTKIGGIFYYKPEDIDAMLAKAEKKSP